MDTYRHKFSTLSWDIGGLIFFLFFWIPLGIPLTSFFSVGTVFFPFSALSLLFFLFSLFLSRSRFSFTSIPLPYLFFLFFLLCASFFSFIPPISFFYFLFWGAGIIFFFSPSLLKSNFHHFYFLFLGIFLGTFFYYFSPGLKISLDLLAFASILGIYFLFQIPSLKGHLFFLIFFFTVILLSRNIFFLSIALLLLWSIRLWAHKPLSRRLFGGVLFVLFLFSGFFLFFVFKHYFLFSFSLPPFEIFFSSLKNFFLGFGMGTFPFGIQKISSFLLLETIPNPTAIVRLFFEIGTLGVSFLLFLFYRAFKQQPLFSILLFSGILFSPFLTNSPEGLFFFLPFFALSLKKNF